VLESAKDLLKDTFEHAKDLIKGKKAEDPALKPNMSVKVDPKSKQPYEG
jgi:hypothetical protein